MPLHARASFEEGACLGIPAITAHACLFSDGDIAGKNVLVAGGAGAVGFYAAQLAALAGARVIATVGSAEQEALVRSAGIEQVLDRRAEGLRDRILELTAGRGADRIVEVAFGANLALDAQVLAPGGVLSIFASDAVAEPALPFRALLLRNATLRFLLVYLVSREAHRRAVRDLSVHLAEGRLRHSIARRLPLSEIAAAHEAMEGDPLAPHDLRTLRADPPHCGSASPPILTRGPPCARCAPRSRASAAQHEEGDHHMKSLFFGLLLAAAACATTQKPAALSGGPAPWMCMPCVQPCTAHPACAEPKLAAAPKPVAPAPAPPPPAAAIAEFFPAPGSFVGTQAVTVTSATPGAMLHCTIDGSEPTADSPACPEPLTLSSNTTVKALVTAPGYAASPVAEGAYTIEPPPPPPLAVVTEEKIELNEKVMFESGKAAVKPDSFPLLDEVARLLKEHPEIGMLTVEGHTDAQGSAATNLRLSNARALAVRKALVARGIDAKRLVAKGYGEERPIAGNDTEEGRETNRRVELTIGK